MEFRQVARDGDPFFGEPPATNQSGTKPNFVCSRGGVRVRQGKVSPREWAYFSSLFSAGSDFGQK